MKIKSCSLVLISLLLLSCQTAEIPRQVAESYWRALQQGDTGAARKMVASYSLQSFDNYHQQPDQAKLPIDQFVLGAEITSINTVIIPEGEPKEKGRVFETVLILENNKWKIDATSTKIPTPESDTEQQLEELSRQLEQTIQDNVETMDDAVIEGMKLLNDVLKEQSTDIGETILENMKELNEALKESVDKMKKKRKEKQLEQGDSEQSEDGLI